MTARAIFFSQLRGACPGLSAPMPTGDGLLVRLLPIGTISLDAFTVLGAAARAHGNGVIEITARGSIQIRGLSAASAPRFADAVAELKIAAGDGVPVLSNPLAGLDPEEILDAARLAADLRSALAGTSVAANLAPKVSVAIDGGGALGLDGLAADVRLAAQASAAMGQARPSSARSRPMMASRPLCDCSTSLPGAADRRGRATSSRRTERLPSAKRWPTCCSDASHRESRTSPMTSSARIAYATEQSPAVSLSPSATQMRRRLNASQRLAARMAQSACAQCPGERS